MLIVFIEHENICIATILMILPSLVFEVLKNVRFSIMAVGLLICIFLQNAQMCQEGIIQLLNLGYIKIRKKQYNVVWTPMQAYRMFSQTKYFGGRNFVQNNLISKRKEHLNPVNETSHVHY